MGGMGSGGAGFIADLRRQSRREDRRREQARARRHARLVGIRLQREHGSQAMSATRWPFPCASVCGQCGALALGADPSAKTSGPARCEHCHAATDALLDLTNRDMASALVSSEAHDRTTHAARHRVVGGPIATTVILAALAMVAFVLGAAPILGATLAAAGVLPGTVAVQRWSGQGSAPTRPRRWAHHPRAEQPTTRTTGAADGELRVAALTGRSCLAYDVRVVWGGERPSAPAAAALHEQVTHGLKIGTTDASRAYMALKPERVSTAQVLASPAAVRYLATRGLEPTDGAFDYYETIIVERDELVTQTDAAGRQEVAAA